MTAPPPRRSVAGAAVAPGVPGASAASAEGGRGAAARRTAGGRLAPTLALAAVSASVAVGYGRVVTGSRWVLPLLVIAVAPHLVGWLLRRRPVALTALASVAVLVVVVVWGLEAHTLRAGLPGPATLDALGRHLAGGPRSLGRHPVPVPDGTGVTLLGVLAVWAMALVADHLATRRRAVLGALTPALLVFVWTAALTGDGDRAVLALVDAAAVVVSGAAFVALQRQALVTTRANAALDDSGTGDPGRGRRPTVGPALAVAVLAAVIGAVVAPRLPGATADPLVDLRPSQRGSSTYQTTIPPLVDVADQLKRSEESELFTVRATAPDYWRTVALDQYSSAGGGQWVLRAEGGSITTGLDDAVPAGALRQQYRIGALSERWMPAAMTPVAVDQPDVLVVESSNTLVTRRRSVTGLRYAVDSVTPVADPTDAQRRATAGPVSADVRTDLELPADVPQSLRDLAASVTAGATTPYDRARLLRDWFRNGQFTYDTDVDLSDAVDATQQFLRDKRGFCVQFASTYALMARAVGLPTRVAVGFTPGDLDPATGRYRVTNHDAHAWPEVWLAGLGWTDRFDPTPPSSAPGGSALPGERLAPPVVPPTVAPTTTPVTGPSATTVPVSPSGPPVTDPDLTPVTVPDGRTPARVGGGVPWPVWAILALGALTALVGTVPAVKAGRRRRRRRRPDPVERIAGAWAEALDRLRDLGLSADATDTPVEIATAAPATVGSEAAPSLARVAVAHTRAQFGAGPVGAIDADAAWDHEDEFERRIDLGRWARARSRWSTASLRDRRRPGSGRATAGRRHRTSP